MTQPLLFAALLWATPSPRPVWLGLCGQGDLIINGVAIGTRDSGMTRVSLTPGSHRAQLVSERTATEVQFDVPEEGPVAPVLLDACPVHRRPVSDAGREIEILSPRWLDVWVDAETEPRLKTVQGRLSLWLTYGRHVLRFENVYAEPTIQLLDVTPESPPRRLVIHLRPKPALLQVVGAPEGSVVQVGDRTHKLVDATSWEEWILVPLDDLGPFDGTLAVPVEVRAPNHVPWQETLELGPAARVTLRPRLQPL